MATKGIGRRIQGVKVKSIVIRNDWFVHVKF